MHRTTKPKKTCDFVFAPKNQTPTPTNLRTGNLKITIFDYFDLRAARRAETEPNSMIPAQKSTQIQFFRAPSAQIISLFNFLKVFLRFPHSPMACIPPAAPGANRSLILISNSTLSIFLMFS